jgi:O-6-methylguanine DNA methyltransferase
VHDERAIARVRKQVEEYCAGKRTDFDLELAPTGTEFQRAVWNALLEIPYGETRSYGEVARAIGQPKAARGVGSANHANPIGLIVPCHRDRSGRKPHGLRRRLAAQAGAARARGRAPARHSAERGAVLMR